MVQTTSPVFPQYARDLRELVDAALDRYAQPDEGCPDRLGQAIRYSLLAPGKRLRPLLVLMAAQACGCPVEAAIPASCAVEMVHAYSLIHDDLPAMDDDDMRRGQPSCHAAFDQATAILAGDALLARAFEVLATDIRPPEVAARCCAELARAAGSTALVGGQADDLAPERVRVDIEHLESIHARKTGAMFLVSLRLGGLVAAAGDEQLTALDTYGKTLGLAFQIIDDLLDYQGDEAVLGKRTGKDADRGKLTFPGLLGIQQSHHRAGQLIGEACQALTPFGSDTSGLEVLAHYVLQRNH